MRARLVSGLLVGSCVLALAVVAISAASGTPVFHARTLTVHVPPSVLDPPIEGLALDGSEAAFVKGVPSSACSLKQRVYRWNLATGGTSLLSGRKTCAQSETSTGAGIYAIALAGSHSAWLLNSGGNKVGGEMLFAATATPGKDKVLATSHRDGFVGTWIGGLVSDGSRLTYATWTGAKGPTGAVGPTGVVTASALWRTSGSTTTRIAQRSGGVIAASADAGRVALLRMDGSAAVYGTNGNLLRTIVGAALPCRPSWPSPARCPGEAIALTGKLVAVLAGGSIRVYDRTSGALLHSWPNISGWAWTFDAYNGIAVYSTGSSLHALVLRTGKDTVVARRMYEIEQARLDKAGLLYYFNKYPWSETYGQDGTLVFVPFKTITTKLAH